MTGVITGIRTAAARLAGNASARTAAFASGKDTRAPGRGAVHSGPHAAGGRYGR